MFSASLPLRGGYRGGWQGGRYMAKPGFSAVFYLRPPPAKVNAIGASRQGSKTRNRDAALADDLLHLPGKPAGVSASS